MTTFILTTILCNSTADTVISQLKKKKARNWIRKIKRFVKKKKKRKKNHLAISDKDMLLE